MVGSINASPETTSLSRVTTLEPLGIFVLEPAAAIETPIAEPRLTGTVLAFRCKARQRRNYCPCVTHHAMIIGRHYLELMHDLWQ